MFITNPSQLPEHEYYKMAIDANYVPILPTKFVDEVSDSTHHFPYLLTSNRAMPLCTHPTRRRIANGKSCKVKIDLMLWEKQPVVALMLCYEVSHYAVSESLGL